MSNILIFGTSRFYGITITFSGNPASVKLKIPEKIDGGVFRCNTKLGRMETRDISASNDALNEGKRILRRLAC